MCSEQGEILFNSGKYTEAMLIYTQCIERDPMDYQSYHRRATCLFSLGEYANALNDSQRAVDLKPGYLGSVLCMSKCYTQLGEFAEAENCLYIALELGQYTSEIKEEVENLGNIRSYLDHLQKYESNNDYPNTLLMLDSLLERASECLSLKIKKLEVLIQLSDMNAALEYSVVLMETSQDAPIVLYLRARCFSLVGSFDRAKTYLQIALKLDPDYTEAKELVKLLKTLLKSKEEGDRLSLTKNTWRAIDIYTAALLLDPKNSIYNSAVLSSRAAIHFKCKDYLKAFNDLNRSLVLNSKSVGTYILRGQVYMEISEFELALNDFYYVKQHFSSHPTIEQHINEAEIQGRLANRKNYYKILQVSEDVDVPQLKKAYKKLALIWHPDKNSSKTETRERAESAFKDINEAYAILIDPKKRRNYDSGLNVDDTNEHPFWFKG